MPRINQQALKTELAKRGFESISIKRELPGGRVEVDANKLHPVHDEGAAAPQTHETHTHELRREGKHMVLRRVRIDCGLAHH